MIVAGTGHRPEKLGGYSPKAYDKVFNVAEAYVLDAQPDLVISGMALGWDQALAEAAWLNGIPFHAYVPFEGQERKWPVKSQRFYRNLLHHAQKVIVVCSGEYASWKMTKRNEAMVDQLKEPEDRLVALWNGDREGGTFNCVRYAEGKQVRVVNLWSQYRGQPVS